MKYYVFWVPEADERLQQIVAQADNKETLKQVIHEIDHWLSRDPHDFGESRFENVRVAFLSPIGILYEILDDHPTVIVLEVWRTDRSSK